MSAPIELFRHCPRCGQPVARVAGLNAIRCPACQFLYHFNPTVAVGALVVADDGRLLLIRRAKDPGKGMLSVPGGFVDAGETADEALRRELREEVNLELDSVEFLCTCANQYPYQGVTYPVMDIFFVARPRAAGSVAALDDVESVGWWKPADIPLDQIAFSTVKIALRRWLEGNRSGSRS